MREGFVFAGITHPGNIYDAIVIKYPHDVSCFSPRMEGSRHSLEEQIDFINKHKIEKALIIAENIDFITKCPTLKYLRVVPADSAGDKFDYSPFYRMPEMKCLQCSTVYGRKEEFSTCIDYSKFPQVENISVNQIGHKNYNKNKTLKSFGISGYRETDLTNMFDSQMLDTLSIIECKIRSLEGLQKSKRMQCLYLYYNRALQDMRQVKKTLKALRIENCPKIEDFSVLGELENLELLQLSGSNTLPSLDFLKTMKNLKTFLFSMDVLDGDLSPCLDLSYVYSERNRKHYNIKDSMLPKGEYVRGNEEIEEWRRFM